MKLVVITCWKYRDAWSPFFQLLSMFWPDCPYSLHLLTDECRDRAMVPAGVSIHEYSGNWCENLYKFARDHPEEPFLLVQEDFFINEPVDSKMVQVAEMLVKCGAGGCRLFPCPPADDLAPAGPFGIVRRSSRYRISCQATIWSPRFVADILSRGTDQTIRPNDWELDGTSIAESMSPEVLSLKGDISPLPFSYLCSGISDGQWMPDAKKLFDKFGIHADWSLRSIMAAE